MERKREIKERKNEKNQYFTLYFQAHVVCKQLGDTERYREIYRETQRDTERYR